MVNNNGNKNIIIIILEVMLIKILMQGNPKSNPQFIKKLRLQKTQGINNVNESRLEKQGLTSSRCSQEKNIGLSSPQMKEFDGQINVGNEIK